MMEFTPSEEALLIAALVSHKFRLKHQLDLFRSGLDPVFMEATEREIDAADVLKDKILKSRS
jgi:hypothetical protein